MSNSHYNFLQDCLRHILGFNSQSLEVPEDLELTDIHNLAKKYRLYFFVKVVLWLVIVNFKLSGISK